MSNDKNLIPVKTSNGVVMVSRRDICQHITKLQEDYKNKSPIEREKIDKQLIYLGSLLLYNPKREKRIQTILSKGRKITEQDVFILNELGVSNERIAKSMGVSITKVKSIISSFYKRKKRGMVSI